MNNSKNDITLYEFATMTVKKMSLGKNLENIKDLMTDEEKKVITQLIK